MGGDEECAVLPKCGWSCPNFTNWTCILIPSTLWFLFALPYFHDLGGVFLIVPILTVIVFFMTVSCLLLVCCSDPGIIPRRGVIQATETEDYLTKVLGYNPLGTGTSDPVPSDLRHNGYKWCRTCKIVRPPRASHCSDCD